jgi:hypothetical protein
VLFADEGGKMIFEMALGEFLEIDNRFFEKFGTDWKQKWRNFC